MSTARTARLRVRSAGMTRALLAILLLLADCGEGGGPDGGAPERSGPSRAEAGAGASNPDLSVSAPPGGRAPAGFVGRWAASPELCASGAWVFSPDRLVTAGEVACDFQEVTADADGWTVRASCTAQAPAEPATLRLSRAEGGGLAVSGGPFQPVTLRLCAENWGTATAGPANP